MTKSDISAFKTLYEGIQFPIEIVNDKGFIVYVNPSFSGQWGFGLSELKEYSVFKDSELKRNNVQSTIEKAFTEKGCFSVSNFSDSLIRSRDFLSIWS